MYVKLLYWSVHTSAWHGYKLIYHCYYKQTHNTLLEKNYMKCMLSFKTKKDIFRWVKVGKTYQSKVISNFSDKTNLKQQLNLN